MLATRADFAGPRALMLMHQTGRFVRLILRSPSTCHNTRVMDQSACITSIGEPLFRPPRSLPRHTRPRGPSDVLSQLERMVLLLDAKAVAPTAGPEDIMPGRRVRRRPAPWYSWSACALARLGTAGLAFVFFVQFAGFCLCGSGVSISGVSISIDPHACCPGSATKANGSSSAGPMPSLASHGQDCCPGMHVQNVVPLSPRDSLPAPHLCAVSSSACFATPTDQTGALGSATMAIGRTSSPPRSQVLRI